MHIPALLITGLLAVVGVNAQAANTGDPLNSFISQVASIASVIDPPSTANPSQTSAATSASPTSETTSPTPSHTSPSSAATSSAASTAAAASSAAAAATSSSGSGLSERDKIILGVCLALGLLLLVLLCLLACCCLRRRRRRRADRDVLAHEGGDWEKHGVHRHSADSRLLGTHRNHFEKGDHHGHGTEVAAAAAGVGVGAAAHGRHSEASDRGLITGAHDADHHRMSGASGPGHADYRHSHGSGMNDLANGGVADPRGSHGSGLNGPMAGIAGSPHSSASPNGGSTFKRKPVPGQGHNGALLGAGAGAGALAGAVAYKHHRDKRDADRDERASYEDNGYGRGHGHDYHDFGDATPPTDRDRPPTPFGLAAFGNGASSRGQAHPFEDSRRTGDVPDATVAHHGRTYPYHHGGSPFYHSMPNRGPRNNGERAYIPYTPAGPYDAALAAGGAREGRHSLPPERRPQRPFVSDEVGNGHRSLGGTPRPSFGDEQRRSSGSGVRVPAAALGAVGRDSPRMPAYNAESSDSSSGRSGHMITGRRGDALGPGLPRAPYASNHASYSSVASEGYYTPTYEIPGSFPGEAGRNGRVHGQGMRDDRWSHGKANGRRLRFSDRNEEYEPEIHD